MATEFMSKWNVDRRELALGWTSPLASGRWVSAMRLRKHFMDTDKVECASPFGNDNDSEGFRLRWTITFAPEVDIRARCAELETWAITLIESVLFGEATIDVNGVITPAATARPTSAQEA